MVYFKEPLKNYNDQFSRVNPLRKGRSVSHSKENPISSWDRNNHDQYSKVSVLNQIVKLRPHLYITYSILIYNNYVL